MRHKLSLLLSLTLLSAVAGRVNAETLPAAPEKVAKDAAYEVDARRRMPKEFEFAYIDKTGKVVINGPFATAHSFNHGVAVVNEKPYVWHDGHWSAPQFAGPVLGNTIIDTKDNTVNKIGLVEVEAFRDEYAVAQLKKNPGSPPAFVLIDTHGSTSPVKKVKRATSYAEGLFAFQSDPEEGATSEAPDAYGYMDKAGKILIPCSFTTAGPFSDGLAAVGMAEPGREQSSGSSKGASKTHHFAYHYIDSTGKTVIAGPFEQARPFCGGLAAVKKAGKWGFIDKAGKLQIPCQYDSVGKFSSPVAPAEKNGQTGFIDKSNNKVIPFKFKKAESFGEDLAPATTDGVHWGYIDSTGTYKIKPAYLGAHPFADGRALVYIKPRTDIGTHPQEAEYFYNTANTLREDGFLNEAVRYCDTAVKLGNGSEWGKRAANLKLVALPDHQLRQDLIDLLQRGTLYAEKHEYEQAAQVFKECLDKDPGFIQASGSLGYCLISQKKFNEAQKVLSATLAKYPNYARGYFRLAQAYEGQGKFSEAQTALDKAKSLAPDDLLFQVYELTQSR